MTRTRISTVSCAAALSLALGVGTLGAQTSRPAGQKPDTPTDSARPQKKEPARQDSNQQSDVAHFVHQAAIAGMAEIELGKMAAQKGQDADVKKFAQMMVDDHTKALNELKQAASGIKVDWPTQLDEKHRQLQQKLSSLSDQQFDREYMKAMVEAHREVEKMVAARAGSESTSSSAKPDAGRVTTERADARSEGAAAERVNQFAAKALPTVRKHLKQAEETSARLEKGAKP